MPRPRKRVCAIRRGPDGSAFQICERCGVSVVIALTDMHDCDFEEKTVKKKLKTQCHNAKIKKQSIEDQPRSAFRLFVESFMKTCNDGNEVEIDSKACEIWKKMSKEERQPFVDQADKLISAYSKLLRKEESEIQLVDHEADSAEVGIYDKDFMGHEIYYDSGSSDGYGLFSSETYESLDTEILLRVCPWATQKTS